ncbi:MAG: hypothetical protein CM15mP21_0190 [Hyphomicrobiales bacterium]|nr:MAG: hypothetical protein CM15mP21_0190 [Hyphomicrobiales bacterium]
MAFVLSEEQTMLRDMAKQFFSEQVPVTNLRQLRDDSSEDGFDRDVWKQIVELGFAGILIRKKWAAPVSGRWASASSCRKRPHAGRLTALFNGGAGCGYDYGCRFRKSEKELLPQIAAGELLMALAIDETNHHNPANIAMAATRDGRFRFVRREKFVIDGHIADKLIVATRTSGEAGDPRYFGISNRCKHPGVTITRRIWWTRAMRPIFLRWGESAIRYPAGQCRWCLSGA